MSSIKQIILLGFVILLSYLFYVKTLSFFFVSDDFFFISFQTLIDSIRFRPDFPHYIPVFMAFMWLLRAIFGPNPTAYHTITVFLHLLNGILVYVLGTKITRNKTLSIAATLLFSFFFTHYEVVFWITGIATSLMTLFYLIGLLAFIRFSNNSRPAWYGIFLISFLAATLSHEFAISLLYACLMYNLMFTKKYLSVSSNFRIFLIPTLLTVLLLSLKISHFSQPSMIHVASLSSFVESSVKSFSYLIFPFPGITDLLPKWTHILVSISLASCYFILFYHNNMIRYFFLWLVITIVLFCLVSVPQARYLYLSSIPAIYVLLLGIFEFRKIKIRYILIILCFFTNLSFLYNQYVIWKKSSEIVKNVTTDFKQMFPVYPTDKKIIFINFPDSLNGPPWNAYLFRNGMEETIEYLYGVFPSNVQYARTMPLTLRLRNDPYLKTIPNGFIVVYDNEINKIILVPKIEEL